MAISDQFILGLQAYQDIKQELQPEAKTAPTIPEPPSLGQLPSLLGPLPAGALLLGMALDGLPVLLDPYDPAPGPILVIGDGGSGKTAFLQSLARGSDLLHDPGDLQFAAFTHFPEEWTEVETLPNSLGIWPAYHRSGRQFLSWLVGRADATVQTRQVTFLLIDGLESMLNVGVEAQHPLHWLLRHGPDHQVWPVVTVEACRMNQCSAWLEYFHTHIFGHVEQPDCVRLLNKNQTLPLPSLVAGSQFGLQRANGWLCFWIPSV
jgi:hypothetical protein